MAVAHRRRRLSFTVRGLLAAVTLAALGLGAWRIWVYPHQLQASAATRFRALGARVETEQGSFRWARKVFGSDRLKSVASINFAAGEFDNATLRIESYPLRRSDGKVALSVLEAIVADSTGTQLKAEIQNGQLMVKGTAQEHAFVRALLAQLEETDAVQPLSDNNLAPLRHCRDLRILKAPHSTFDDAALSNLTCFHSLTELHLEGTEVTDRGLSQLRKFPNLRVLKLNKCQVSDAGLRSLAECAHLENVSLADTSVTDQGLQHLVALSNLKSLHLNGCNISDAGMPALAKCQRLEELGLQDLRVTDLGVASLLPLVNLKSLDLTGARISAKSLATINQFPDTIEVIVDDTSIPVEESANNPRVRERASLEEFLRALRGGGRGREQLPKRPPAAFDPTRAL